MKYIPTEWELVILQALASLGSVRHESNLGGETDARSLEWALVENSQCVDVHPYEEAQGSQQSLDFPGYDVTAPVEKSGKSASHSYAALSSNSSLR